MKGPRPDHIRDPDDDPKVIFECWPRDLDVSKDTAKQFLGWPKTINMGN